MIIDTSYFLLAPLALPNAKPTAGGANNLQDLQAAIDRVEYDVLINALGYEQYTELISQFNSDGTWITDPLQKWVDLVDGKGQWRGLRYNVGVNKVSLIAYYVYYRFLANSSVFFTTTGLSSNRAENSVKVMPEGQLCDIWNAFAYMYQGGYDYRFSYFNWCDCNEQPYEYSLLRFMSENADVYNVNYFKYYELKNLFGI